MFRAWGTSSGLQCIGSSSAVLFRVKPRFHPRWPHAHRPCVRPQPVRPTQTPSPKRTARTDSDDRCLHPSQPAVPCTAHSPDRRSAPLRPGSCRPALPAGWLDPGWSGQYKLTDSDHSQGVAAQLPKGARMQLPKLCCSGPQVPRSGPGRGCRAARAGCAGRRTAPRVGRTDRSFIISQISQTKVFTQTGRTRPPWGRATRRIAVA